MRTKWEDIALNLRREVKPGKQLPSEAQLRKRFGVSRATARRALHALELEGRVHVIPGRGWFGVPDEARCPTCGQDIRRLRPAL